MATIQTLYNDDPTGVRVTLDTNRIKINDNFTAVNADLATKYVKPSLGIPLSDLALSVQQQVQAVPSIGPRVLVTSWADVQAAHDTLKAAGGGEIHFIPNATYNVPAGSGVTIDIAWVGLQFNGAIINCAAWYGATAGTSTNGDVFYITSTRMSHDFSSIQQIRKIENGILLGSVAADTIGDWGPTAFRFASATPNVGGDHVAVNCVLSNMMVIGFRRNAEYGSHAYFVRWNRSFLLRAWSCIYTSAGTVVDNVERNHFSQCVVAENRVAVDSTQNGQWYHFSDNTSIDYNKQLFNLGLGSQVYMNQTHIEFGYGDSSTETDYPIVLTGADSCVKGRQLTLTYATATFQPFWESFVSCDNSSQVVDLEFDTVANMGRVNQPTKYDAWVMVQGVAYPSVRVRANPAGVLPQQVPSMTLVAESYGAIGMLRNGINWPHGQLLNVTKWTGTANAPADVSSTENGVPLKVPGKNMWKFQNSTPGSSALYYVTFPRGPLGSRMAWMFFNNLSATGASGSLNIKVLMTVDAAAYDGTNITNVKALAVPAYELVAGVTLTAGAAGWNRHSWKDHCNGNVFPAPDFDVSRSIALVFDLTNYTGAFYTSCWGLAPITLGR